MFIEFELLSLAGPNLPGLDRLQIRLVLPPPLIKGAAGIFSTTAPEGGPLR